MSKSLTQITFFQLLFILQILIKVLVIKTQPYTEEYNSFSAHHEEYGMRKIKIYHNKFSLNFLRENYGLISIGVPVGTASQTTSISSLLKAIHPFVQLNNWATGESHSYPLLCPWITIEPPGLTPRFLASARSFALGFSPFVLSLRKLFSLRKAQEN